MSQLNDNQFEELFPYFKGANAAIRLNNSRMGNQDLPEYKKSTVPGERLLASRLKGSGGFPQ